MKTRRLSSIVFLFLLGALLLTTAGVQAQNPQPFSIEGGGGPGPVGSAFSYQGLLKLGGQPYTGTCDFNFKLYDQSSVPGNQIGATETDTGVSVSKGLFTVVLNASSQFNPAGTNAFKGDMRWLEIAVRCPAGSGIYTTLAPRQVLWAVPYAISLMPGARVEGTAYQVLKVQSYAATGSIPAGVTGEIKTATDGVGVYGSNEVSSTGATGMGVWGRTWSPDGAGVKGTGHNGAAGVYGEAFGTGALGGKGVFGVTESPQDEAIGARNTGGGDLYHGVSAAGDLVFQVFNNGAVWSNGGYTSGGADVAEQFAVSGAAPEPGTLMVIDAGHPGQLKPSSSAYDSKVAGVVSGAGGLQPGVTLSEQDGVAIALAGRVYVKAEAFSGAIAPGDLLTSSDLPGYAMKASDRSRAAGAVIGKAMTGLDSGTGLVLVLVSLQ